MNALVFLVQADAVAYAAAIDATYGYPKPGVDVGPGAHVPPAQSVTTRHNVCLKHPTLPQWAYPIVGAETAAVPSPVGAPVALPITWDGAAPIDAGPATQD